MPRQSKRQQPPSVPAVLPSARMHAWQQPTKIETRLLGRIERMLIEQGDGDEPRRDDVLHVSEITHDDFCPRAAYYRMTGAPLLVESTVPMRLQAIFEEGHVAHIKWQAWVRRLGTLYGRWRCLVCGTIWMGVSPERCEGEVLINQRTGERVTEPTNDALLHFSCWATAECIVYMEVPVYQGLTEYMVTGSADGMSEDVVIEAKTIGVGTVRVEAPRMLSTYTKQVVVVEKLQEYLDWWEKQPKSGRDAAFPDVGIPVGIRSTFIDHDSLWKDARAPFITHLKQGNIYGFLLGLEEALFIYEYKPNQAYKEFVVKVSPSVYEPPLELALDVKWAVENLKAPVCPHGGCKQCGAYEGVHSASKGSTTTGRGRRVARRPAGMGTTAGVPDAPATGRSNVARRSRADASVPAVRRMG
jgi:hypothetical protein